MTVYIVTGLGYGDEGKGTTVDYLCRQDGSTANLVVRHNGGPQAGHNVVLPDGTHHEFSQFGAGTLAGASTFLSRFMLINPTDMELEAQHLSQLGVREPFKHMHVDIEARIITPYHVALNRVQERARGENRHGSCGRGIGVLMAQDIDRPDLTLRVGDLINGQGWVREKLEYLRRYLNLESKDYGLSWLEVPQEFSVLHHGRSEVAEQYADWATKVFVVTRGAEWLADQLDWHQNVIFEGAQGVLLDEWHGFHPYTTWSTTTHANAMTLLNESYQGPVTRLGVTRAYMTRHGAGPFVSEDTSVAYDEPHNVTGQFQGAFRQGHLDLVALRYAIDVCGGVDGLVVTHLDRSNVWNLVNAYQSTYFHDIRELMTSPVPQDLEWQKLLTNQLLQAHAVYGKSSRVDTAGLLEILGRLAPVHIESYGPTHKDKEPQP